jgi:hypothetical protein
MVTAFADGLWLDEAPVSILGMRLTTRMAVVRLRGDALLLWSPIELTDDRRAAVEALGVVEHLYAPNLFHHLWLDQWASAFPSARVHAPAGLAEKRRDLRIDRVQGAEPEPALEGVVDEVPIEGFRLRETVILHRATRTLFVADLVHAIGRPTHGWTRFYSRAMGFYDRVALSRMIRWTAFADRSAARRSVDAVLALPFDRIVVGHGTPITEGARDSIAAAYAWL